MPHTARHISRAVLTFDPLKRHATHSEKSSCQVAPPPSRGPRVPSNPDGPCMLALHPEVSTTHVEKNPARKTCKKNCVEKPAYNVRDSRNIVFAFSDMESRWEHQTICACVEILLNHQDMGYNPAGDPRSLD